MDNLTTQTFIDSMTKMILARIKGQRLYGKEIDTNNPNDIILAAYYLGMIDGVTDYTRFIQPFNDSIFRTDGS